MRSTPCPWQAALIQSASQAMSETQEKIKILENELEVLRRESLSKDKSLVRVRRELHDERTNCENLRIEANKLYNGYKQKKKHIQVPLLPAGAPPSNTSTPSTWKYAPVTPLPLLPPVPRARYCIPSGQGCKRVWHV